MKTGSYLYAGTDEDVKTGSYLHAGTDEDAKMGSYLCVGMDEREKNGISSVWCKQMRTRKSESNPLHKTDDKEKIKILSDFWNGR